MIWIKKDILTKKNQALEQNKKRSEIENELQKPRAKIHFCKFRFLVFKALNLLFKLIPQAFFLAYLKIKIKDHDSISINHSFIKFLDQYITNTDILALLWYYVKYILNWNYFKYLSIVKTCLTHGLSTTLVIKDLLEIYHTKKLKLRFLIYFFRVLSNFFFIFSRIIIVSLIMIINCKYNRNRIIVLIFFVRFFVTILLIFE